MCEGAACAGTVTHMPPELLTTGGHPCCARLLAYVRQVSLALCRASAHWLHWVESLETLTHTG